MTLTTATPIRKIRLFATTLGHRNLHEFAQIFAEGFRKNGITTDVVFDKIPSPTPAPDLVQIVIAPHEFFVQFLEPKLYPDELESLRKAVYALVTEPHSDPGFPLAWQQAQLTRGILALHPPSVTPQSVGNEILHAPIGYASCLEAEMDPVQPLPRSIDLLFWGHHSPKREQFFSKHAAFFNRHNSHLLFSRPHQPPAHSPTHFSSSHTEQQRYQLLRSSKILIVLHNTDHPEFDWSQALPAIANRCLIISENSESIAPLINRQHLIVTDLDKIPAECEYYLTHPEERCDLVDRAYHVITTQLDMGRLCQPLLNALNQSCHLPVHK